ncbi:TetR/AcrR family transcriptional regulator [Modestobacter sp. VKM Ac-2979]|uniref:TetR/AcrR family transcriptional regulator n=1 Tax=unclassified Modestobacter TaxID=2643866 RepID=UPI0022AB6FED|nr:MULTISPECIES: TetR/AcrR family transcriptional regulator [unclassified Modestobacter]MCZ2814436.1 TetR/AcrR family transcriptional regulator [Modestobacter sp. VKM Ac-2979]MCZ2844762.1 TetR/AcrR family transcriptional regulator [Modestobacter sp. VKM Ac-2980]
MTAPTPAVRADAARNREALLRAARDEYDKGDGTLRMHAIARQAGVGVGTMYRHFPTRDDLLEALAMDQFAEIVGIAERAAVTAAADPDQAVRSFLLEILHLRCDPGLTRLLISGTRPSADGQGFMERFQRSTHTLVDTAHASGWLRPAISTEQFVTMLYGAMLSARETGQIAALAPLYAEVLAAGMKTPSP